MVAHVLAILFFFIPEYADSQNVVLNEFMSLNATIIQDEDGDYSDWIEMYNRSDATVNLKGYYISDDTLDPAKWQFPEVHITPGNFLIVFASSKDRTDTLYLHTNFKLSGPGEYLVLSDSLLNRMDMWPPVPLEADLSYGRFPDGDSALMELVSATPGLPNSGGSTLTFSHFSGVYNRDFYLKIFAGSAFDSVKYTFNGNIPDSLSPVYTDSLLISFGDTDSVYYSLIPSTPDSMGDYLRLWKTPKMLIQKARIVRFRGFSDGVASNTVYTLSFFPDSLFAKVRHFPVVSLITDSSNMYDHQRGIYIPGYYFNPEDTDWTGNYFMKTQEWERPVHVTYFDTAGIPRMEQDAGMRVHGKITRHAPQKSLRMYARSDYGNSWFNYPLIKQVDLQQYKRFLLQTTYGDGWQTMFKDQMITRLVSNLNLDLLHSEPVHMFINGEYWGFSHLRQYFDQNYLEQMHGIDPDNVDILENNMEVEEGDTVNYNQLLTYIGAHDLTQPEIYDSIQNWIDIDNYIDYQIVEIYFNNNDWPGSNVDYWREKKEGAKWRWLLYDLDASCFNPEFNSMEYATSVVDTSWQNPPWSTYLFRSLLVNEDFKNQFISRFAELLNSTFKTSHVVQHINDYKAKIDSLYELHNQRWDYPISYHDWEWAIEHSMLDFAIKRPCIIAGYIKDYFELEEFGFSCDTNSIPVIKTPAFKLQAYPNPAADRLNIVIEYAPGMPGILSLHNILGKTVYESGLPISQSEMHEINLKDIHPGIYLLKVSYGHSTISRKIIIQ